MGLFDMGHPPKRHRGTQKIIMYMTEITNLFGGPQ